MRVLRLAVDRDHVVDLHPGCSIVAGLGAERSTNLRRAIAAIGVGLAPELPGLAEAHGVLLGTGQPDLDLLDLGADPVRTVATPATVASDPSDLPERLRSSEGEVLACAAERHRAATTWRRTQVAPTATERDLARAEQLRSAVVRHEQTDAEPLRFAVDDVRDLTARAVADGALPGIDALTVEASGVLLARLAALGVDLGPHERIGPLDLAEVRRVAEDWIDEHRRRAVWVVGARVELDGIERRVRRSSAEAGGPLPESAERRVVRATASLARALARADELREGSHPAGDAPPGPDDDLEVALRRRIDQHRRDRVAGAAPLLLHRVLDGIAEDDLGPLLDRLVDHASGVQLVVVDDRPEAAAWARGVGHRRAALVGPALGRLA